MRPSLVQCLAATWLATAPASAATSSGDPHGWSRLRLEHAGFALDATLDITRDEQAAASLPTGNITGHEALGASGATVGQLVMNSEFRLSPLFQRHRRSVLWFDPADHAALWSTRETTGAGAGYRSVRYAAGGLELLRATPATSAERKAAPSTWSTRERSLVDYGTAGQHCNAVTEASVLLLLDPGSLPEGLCIVSKQRLLRPVFSPAEAADVALDVLAHHADGTSTTLRYTDARRYALYPHMSVFENMSFALKLAKVPQDQIRQKVERAAQILNLTQYLQRTPKELSGGQRQRVAIGRAIVRAPKVFLFDEPLSNLDAALRGQTRIEIAKLHRDLGATTVYVTHDQVEAMTLADRVVVLRDGRIEQVGTPLELYDRPANQFVAQFIGTPQMNIISAPHAAELVQATGLAVPAGGAMGLRPEHLQLCAPGGPQLQARVELIEALGAETLVYLSTAAGVPLVVRQNTRSPLRVHESAGIAIDADAAHLFDSQGRISRVGRTPSH